MRNRWISLRKRKRWDWTDKVRIIISSQDEGADIGGGDEWPEVQEDKWFYSIIVSERTDAEQP